MRKSVVYMTILLPSGEEQVVRCLVDTGSEVTVTRRDLSSFVPYKTEDVRIMRGIALGEKSIFPMRTSFEHKGGFVQIDTFAFAEFELLSFLDDLDIDVLLGIGACRRLGLDMNVLAGGYSTELGYVPKSCNARVCAVVNTPEGENVPVICLIDTGSLVSIVRTGLSVADKQERDCVEITGNGMKKFYCEPTNTLFKKPNGFHSFCSLSQPAGNTSCLDVLGVDVVLGWNAIDTLKIDLNASIYDNNKEQVIKYLDCKIVKPKK